MATSVMTRANQRAIPTLHGQRRQMRWPLPSTPLSGRTAEREGSESFCISLVHKHRPIPWGKGLVWRQRDAHTFDASYRSVERKMVPTSWFFDRKGNPVPYEFFDFGACDPVAASRDHTLSHAPLGWSRFTSYRYNAFRQFGISRLPSLLDGRLAGRRLNSPLTQFVERSIGSRIFIRRSAASLAGVPTICSTASGRLTVRVRCLSCRRPPINRRGACK